MLTILKIIKKILALESHSSKSQGREIQSPLPLKIKAVNLQLYEKGHAVFSANFLKIPYIVALQNICEQQLLPLRI